MDTNRERPSDREAQRALIVDALARLPEAPDRHEAAHELMRALDAYIEDRRPVREAPVMDYARAPSASPDQRWVLWLVLACGVLATFIAAVALEGGWLAGAVILAIWAAALVAISTS